MLSDAMVYIDDDGIIYDASLNQTNIGGNNNKVREAHFSADLFVLIPHSSIVCSSFTKGRMTLTSPIPAGGASVILVR